MTSTPTKFARQLLPMILIALLATAGCGGGKKKDKTFFTSGSREADQRADQRMVRENQLKGTGEGAGDKGKDAKPGASGDNPDIKKPLYERLGGADAVTAIVDDFVTRALADPRVNWDRDGVTTGSWWKLQKKKSVAWDASPENVKRLKLHIAQFLTLATGGPSKYEGKDMKQAHANMRITNPQFDAAVGDLKATLDKLQIPNQEQKELLSIVESTRPQIVEER